MASVKTPVIDALPQIEVVLKKGDHVICKTSAVLNLGHNTIKIAGINGQTFELSLALKYKPIMKTVTADLLESPYPKYSDFTSSCVTDCTDYWYTPASPNGSTPAKPTNTLKPNMFSPLTYTTQYKEILEKMQANIHGDSTIHVDSVEEKEFDDEDEVWK